MGLFRRTLLRTALASIAICTGCNPYVSNLNPTTGHDRELVVAVAAPIFTGMFIWDAGSGEMWRSGGAVGQMFTVPGGATIGPHLVQRYASGIRSSSLTYTVDEVRPFPRPRVDRVSLLSTEFKPGDIVTPSLYVQGANVDVGAAIEVGVTISGSTTWTAVSSAAHRGMTNRGWDETLGLSYKSLDYPIYHFLAFMAFPGDLAAGSTILVRIRNEDSVASDEFAYKLPLTAGGVDSDGDGILDQDETGDARIRPDVRVELDHMEDPASPLHHPWSHDIAIAMQDVYAGAPVITPYGPTGINLIIDDSQSIPRNVVVSWNGDEDTSVQAGNCTAANISASRKSFLTLKRACFDPVSRGSNWHYCIWAGDAYLGAMQVGGQGEPLGDDCIVAADPIYTDAWMADPRTEAELVTHELGHNFGLHHGGGASDFEHNPAYNSIMSSNWLGRNHFGPTSRKKFPVCTTLYYQVAAASSSELEGAMPPGVPANLWRGYSDGMGRHLVENHLEEKTVSVGAPYGVCDNTLDWDCALAQGVANCDGNTTDLNVTRDLNSNYVTTDRLDDFPDWTRIILNLPVRKGPLTLLSDP